MLQVIPSGRGEVTPFARGGSLESNDPMQVRHAIKHSIELSVCELMSGGEFLLSNTQ